YEGRVSGGLARLKATLDVSCFTDGPAVLALPLTGVQLGEALLDGAAALPRAEGDRYQVPVQGRGSPSLELAFTVPCPDVGDDRELRFGIPESLLSRLTLVAPAGATHLQTLAWRGAQTVAEEAGRPRLDVDLGRVGTVHVRWHAGAPAARPP